MYDLAFESVIVCHPDALNQEVVERAEDRLKILSET